LPATCCLCAENGWWLLLRRLRLRKGTGYAAISRRMVIARPTRHQDGVTLVETLVAVVLVGAFFETIFEVNAVCLRYIEASKEAVAAVQGVQDRIEGLRNLCFTNLTSSTYMMNPQPTPSPSGPRPVSLVYPSNSSDLAARVTEEVTVSAYPSGSPSITYNRAPGAAVYPNASPNATGDFSSVTLVRVKVRYTWNSAVGGRQQNEETETLIAAGTKK
jgi:Tfp pilus assembly protein PilV